MTDAERIAEYCTNHESALVTAEDVQRWRDGYPLPKTTALMTMLSDVRREEREASQERCLEILMRVGIAAMEAGHTNVGKYITAASTQIRASQ